MCLFRNKGIFDIKLNIIKEEVLKEFWRVANIPPLIVIELADRYEIIQKIDQTIERLWAEKKKSNDTATNSCTNLFCTN